MKRILFPLTAIFFILFFATGCGSDNKAASTNNSATVVSDKTSASVKEEAIEKLKFKTPEDTEALYIKRYSDHEKLEINFEGVTAELKARSNDKGRLKYKESSQGQDKAVVAEVKYKEESIKLVDEKEQLLFKIKFSEDKIKIANNEDMTSPFELKTKSPEKIEIRDSSGNEIGNVKFYADTGKLKVKDNQEKEILVIKNFKLSAAPGVILFKDIPAKLRCIILNEILKKER